MLSLAAVSAGYGSFQALFGVSLEVSRGEAIGVIGPNGAGKTTLMRVISGLLPLRGGAMTLEGRPISGLPSHLMVEQGIAHVPENRRLFPRLSVEERYRSKEEYLERITKSANDLAARGYLIKEDVQRIVQQAGSRWDWVMGNSH